MRQLTRAYNFVGKVGTKVVIKQTAYKAFFKTVYR